MESGKTITMYQPNFTELDKLVEQGYLRKQVSPCGKLFLLDYTDKCTYERKWNKHTENNRGTVYEITTGKVISRPYKKFYNFGELTVSRQRNLLKSKEFLVLEKLDGSMIQAFYYNNKWNFATRGSFTSDQAKKAEEIVLKNYSNHFDHLRKDVTLLFEVIYPENRIVVDYNKEEDIKLTAVFHTESGEELLVNYEQNFFNTCKKFTFNSIQEVLDKLKTLTYNEEGYVVRFSDGTRVKFKGDEYVKMHRIITGLSPLTLWETMKDGKVSEELLASIPEEFSQTYIDMVKQLECNYKNVLNEVKDSYRSILSVCGNDNKEIGLFLKKNDIPYSHMIFPLHNGKEDVLDYLITKEIRPTGNKLDG